jgi:hypothetical protein
MTTAKQYAKWCMMLLEGESDEYLILDMYKAMYQDGFVDDDNEWYEDEEENV